MQLAYQDSSVIWRNGADSAYDVVQLNGTYSSYRASPLASKLEFVDNVGILNETAADASIRTSSLATDSKEAATMKISLKKT